MSQPNPLTDFRKFLCVVLEGNSDYHNQHYTFAIQQIVQATRALAARERVDLQLGQM